ncbi:MAG TPA: ABC transporter substrate-binding protein [Candidatus Binatia bacterium]|nr:ABC transporter substrate-binding protein [Candidatus Binatia bacterium]
MKWVGVLAILLVLAGCAAPQNQLKVGAILPMTGSFAFVGAEEQNAISMANNETGNTLQVIFEDSAGENPKAIAAFNKLSNVDNAHIVITSTSWISNTIYPQAADAQAFQVILASSGFKRTRDDYAVRFTADVGDEAGFIANFLKKYDTIAIIHLNNDFGKGWADALSKDLGDKIVAVETYDPTDTDMSAQLTKIKAKNPDVLFLASSGKDGAFVAKKAKELGINAQLVSQRPIETPELLKQGDAAEGLIYSFPATAADHPFLAKYQKTFGRVPSIFTIEAYDATIRLTAATKQCGDDAACLKKAFANSQYEGALGSVAFDAKGDAHYPFVLKQVKNGKFTVFGE